MDRETKRDFEVFCDNVGINLTTAFNMFVKATLRARALPFAVCDTDSRKQARKEFIENIEAMQAQSVLNGTDTISMDEIDDIIKEARQENRRQANG